MAVNQNSASYAKGLFKIEGSSEQIRQREENLQSIAEILKMHPKILNVLACPELEVEARLSTLEKIVNTPSESSVRQLTALLLKRGKIAYMMQIASDYAKLVINSLKEIDVEITSPEPLSDKTRQFLREKLEKQFQKKVVFFETTDPSLLGGFTISVHNQLLDLSIKSEIMNLKKQLLKAEI